MAFEKLILGTQSGPNKAESWGWDLSISDELISVQPAVELQCGRGLLETNIGGWTESESIWRMTWIKQLWGLETLALWDTSQEPLISSGPYGIVGTLVIQDVWVWLGYLLAINSLLAISVFSSVKCHFLGWFRNKMRQEIWKCFRTTTTSWEGENWCFFGPQLHPYCCGVMIPNESCCEVSGRLVTPAGYRTSVLRLWRNFLPIPAHLLCPWSLGSHRKGWDLGDSEKEFWPWPVPPLTFHRNMLANSASVRILIKGGKVVNDDCTHEADVYIENGIIQQVGRELMIPGGAKVIDATGKLVIPGGIDTSTHFHQTFMNATCVDDFYHGTKVMLLFGESAFLGGFLCFWGCSGLDPHEQGAPAVLLKGEGCSWRGHCGN